MTKPRRHLGLTSSCLLLAAAAWVLLIWSFRFVPMEDYARWLCSSRVFSLALQGHAVPGFSLAHWPVPNSAFIVITGLLELVTSYAVAGKLYLTACILLYCAGAYLLLGAFTPRRDSALFLLPMLYVFHKGMWAGELSYSFGLGIFFLAAAYVLRAARPSSIVVCLISIALFFCHAIPYICWGVLLCSLIALDPGRVSRLKTVLAVVPSVALFLLYLRHGTGQHLEHTGLNVLGVLRQTPRFWSLFSPLHFFAPFFSTDPRWLKTAAVLFNACAVAAVLALILVWLYWFAARFKRETSTVRAALVAPLVLLLLFALFPFEAMTGVPDFNYRFLLPAFLLVLATLVPELQSGPVSRFAAVAAVSLAVVFHFGYIARVSGLSQQVYAELAQANLNPDFRDVSGNLFEPLAPSTVPRSKLLPVHDALYTFVDYLRLERQWTGPVFTTSFVLPSAGYSPLIGNTDPRTVWPRQIAVIGSRPVNRQIVSMLPDRYRVASEADYVLVLNAADQPQDAVARLAAK